MKAPLEAAPEADAYPGAPHPRAAARLVGHGAAETEMLESFRSGRLPHAWLIGGQEGIGKATLAWRFARFVLAHPDPSAPATQAAVDLSVDASHPAAKLLASHAHPDFSTLRRRWEPKGKRFYGEIRVDDVREGLALFRLAPAFNGFRVAIVDAADELNRSGANALLKLIEEPPTRSLILILAHRPGQVLPTIRSRCRRILLDPLSPAQIVEIVGGLGQPWSKAGAAKITESAARAGGSVREALRRLDPETAEVGAAIDAAVAQLPRTDSRVVHRLAEVVAARGADDAYEALLRAMFDALTSRARDDFAPARLEAIAGLWDRLRATARESEALNLDRRLTVLSLFQEFAGAGI